MRHKALIVDSDREAADHLANLLRKLKITVLHEPDPSSGFRRVSKAKIPFALIVWVHRMGMKDVSDFLEKIREIAPYSIRFLLTESDDIDLLIDAINRGAIHRYIRIPWAPDQLADAVRKCLADYELVSENERLLDLAKAQSLKLYDLIKELREKEELYKNQLETMDLEIEALKASIDIMKGNKTFLEETARETIREMLEDNALFSRKGRDIVLNSVLYELMEQCNEIAMRHGFDAVKDIPGPQ